MSRTLPSENPDKAGLLDDLHAHYDGRPPRRSRLAALAGGNEILIDGQQHARQARLRAHCAGALLAVARRRQQMAAAQALEDPWLMRLTAALRDARDGLAV